MATPESEAITSPTKTPVEGEQQPTERSNRVYVGNLAWKVTWQQLKDHMRQRNGNVVRADIFEDHLGRSRGCGIVEYETEEQAKDAIENLTDTELYDRKIFVREDREERTENRSRRPLNNSPRGGRGGRGGYTSGSVEPAETQPQIRRGGRNGGGFNEDGFRKPVSSRRNGGDSKNCQLFIGNLPYKATWKDLKELFNEEGTVVRADVSESNGRSRGYGTVVFETPEHAYAAIDSFNDHDFMGRKILVRLDEGPPRMRQ